MHRFVQVFHPLSMLQYNLLVLVLIMLYFYYFTDLVQSTSLFRKAAGVYHHIAHEVLPNLQHNLRPEGPPEALTTVSDVFSLICLAEAQVSLYEFQFLFFGRSVHYEFQIFLQLFSFSMQCNSFLPNKKTLGCCCNESRAKRDYWRAFSKTALWC